MHTIYYLENPLTGNIFYVGVTRRTLEERVMGHYGECSTPTSKALKGKKLKPLIHEIETVNTTSFDVAKSLEEYWILQFCAWNFPLENKTIAFGRKMVDNRKTRVNREESELNVLCSKKILALAETVSKVDKKEMIDTLNISYHTARRYLNGTVKNVDLGIKIYIFLKNRVQSKEEVLPA